MKRVLIMFCLFLSALITYPQEPDKGLVEVRYSFIHIRDTTKRNAPYTENMFLVAGKNASRYTSLDRVNHSVKVFEISREARMSGVQPDAATQMEINAKYRAVSTKPISNTEYYFYSGSHKLFVTEDIGRVYFVEEPDPGPTWKISKDTLSFSGVHCQKATTTFKGRNWIAWFATELAFESGPWKLNGLPGLILEAYDDKNEVQFRFAGLRQIKEGDLSPTEAHLSPEFIAFVRSPGNVSSEKHLFDITKIIVPDLDIRATRKEFDRVKEARAGIQTGGGGGFGGGGGNMTAPPPIARTVTPLPATGINNPIELPATK